MLNCHAVCACGMINDLWRLQSISTSHFCRGREGQRGGWEELFGPEPETLLAFASSLIFLRAKFNNCELCAVCFLFYRFVSRNFYDYFGPVTETDEETRLWLELRLRLWPVMVMGGQRGYSAATESSTEVRANCVARDREPIQKSPSNQSQSQSESQAKPGISLFCLALIAQLLNWTDWTDWPTGPVDDFLHSQRNDATRDATQQRRRRVKPKLKLRVQVKRKPQKIRSWLTYLNLFQTCYI